MNNRWLRFPSLRLARWMAKRREIYQSPLRLLLLIALTIFVVHLIAMALLAFHHRFSPWAEWAIESSALVLLLFPVLYFFSFRPLNLSLRETLEAEAQMRESEHKYRTLFEQLSEAAFLVDVQTGRVLDTNSQGERLLGRPRGEIMGLNQSQLFPPAKPASFQAWLALLAGESRRGDFDAEVLQKNGSLTPVHVGAAHVTLYGRRLILALCRDLSARKPPAQAGAAPAIR